MTLRRRHLLSGFACVWLLATGNLCAQDSEVHITALFNNIRREHGLGIMAVDQKLRQVADLQARRMARHNKLKHSLSIGQGLRSRLAQAGVRGQAAENIASGQRDGAEVFAAWMRSDGHRRNLLDPIFGHYGLAAASPEKRPDYLYWALVLGV